MKNFLLITGLFYSGLLYAATPSPSPEVKTCLASREYITTVKFLRDKKEYQLTEAQIKRTADTVSTGCSGASQQFIKIMKLLTKMGIDSSSSLKTALNFVHKEESFAKAFIEIFRQTYDPKYLDLDALSAMKISLQLSAQYKGDVDKSLSDFRELVQYCLTNKSMELPTARCAQLATKITMLGQDYTEAISTPFIDLMSFLQESDKGPKFDKNTSLKISESVLKYGPLAEKNFKQAYIFATSKDGLAYDLKTAIPFAKEMAKRSVKKLKSVK